MMCFKNLPVILLFSVSLFACKKYDEGPALSMHSKKARLENKWRYEKILINEKEKELTQEEKEFRLKFEKDGIAVKEIYNPSWPASFVGNWYWQEHKEKIKVVFDYSYFGNPRHDENVYEILKLKNKELWLQEIISNDTLQYHLIPD